MTPTFLIKIDAGSAVKESLYQSEEKREESVKMGENGGENLAGMGRKIQKRFFAFWAGQSNVSPLGPFLGVKRGAFFKVTL